MILHGPPKYAALKKEREASPGCIYGMSSFAESKSEHTSSTFLRSDVVAQCSFKVTHFPPKRLSQGDFLPKMCAVLKVVGLFFVSV